MWFQKKLHSTSAWVLYCKFTGDLQNTFLQEQVINNTFCWLVFIIYRPEFVDWSKTFLKVYFILYIFWNNFPNGCCNWSTYYIFIPILSQINLCCNCRSSPPQVCSSRMIIWSTAVINVRSNNFINNRQMSRGYFYFIHFTFDQSLCSPKYGA